jgi:hypothetical protein
MSAAVLASFARAALLGAGCLIVLASLGCDGKYPIGGRLVPNQRPTVDLTAAPVSSADTAWYSYHLYWSGNDADGQVDHFEYAIDPPIESDSDTLWIRTQKNDLQLFFRATQAYFDPKRGWRSNDRHRFVIRAIDNSNEASAPRNRSFYSYTIAPVVFITAPSPTKFISRQVAPALRIAWQGRDEDGVFTQKPVKYRYRLFKQGDTEFDFQKAQLYPDSLRIFYAERNFAGWDSVGGDTTFAQYTQLTPGSAHLFVVIGIDEAGAYSPDFSLETNMLRFTPGFANTLGPIFTVFNEFIQFTYLSGGYSADPLAWINLEVPAGRPVTFNWFAVPPEGGTMEFYRWRLDGDLGDETARSNESTDWYHWSRKNNLTETCTFGPFAGGEEHFLYIEGQDNNGLRSLAIVHFRTIQPSFEKELLVIDDTRLLPDRKLGAGILPYGNNQWPAAAELDTFFFAKGGYPWRGPQGVSGNLPLSKPGVFNGYSFDTLGTRKGYELASAGVPLALLGRYRHLLWYTDIAGAITPYGPLSLVDPISTLRWMCAPSRMNTLATYLNAGGEAWLAGGTAATCLQLGFNATGSRNNDNKYGPGHAPIFSFSAGELVPGRILWDYAHWRSEVVVSKPNTQVIRSTAAVGGWSNPGWRFVGAINAPDYSRLPAVLRRRSLALGDSLPATRTDAQGFYSTATWPGVEYLTDDNAILEDFDPSPLVEDQRAALDTLYELQGGQLATNITGRRPVAMTYYHGVESPRFLMTGFDLWTWSRQDITGLVDFVLHEIWGMNRQATGAAAGNAATAPAPAPPPGTALPGAAGLPGAGGRSRQ